MASTGAACTTESTLIKDGPLVYCYSPAVEPPPGSYLFSATYATADQVRVVIRFCRQLGWTRIAMVNSTDPSGVAAERIRSSAVLIEPGVTR